jgi:hypothetical protein
MGRSARAWALVLLGIACFSAGVSLLLSYRWGLIVVGLAMIILGVYAVDVDGPRSENGKPTQ